MDFIADNYVWFIVIGIVILMAVIGYIADKTDFGRKTIDEGTAEKPKKQKNVKSDKKESKIKVEPKGINELSQKATDNVKKEKNDTKLNTQDVTQVEKKPVNNENIDQSLFAPLTDNKPVEPIKEPEKSDNEELKSIEPTKLENPIPENASQPVAEDEDIWKF